MILEDLHKDKVLAVIMKTMAETIYKNLRKGSKVTYAEKVEFEPVMDGDMLVDIKLTWL